MRLLRARGPRRVRGAALRPDGLLLSCAGAWTLTRAALKSGLSQRRCFLVGNNRSAKLFSRPAASGASRDGWRALGGLGRAVVGTGHLRGSQQRGSAGLARPPRRAPGCPAPPTRRAEAVRGAERCTAATFPSDTIRWPAPATIVSTGTRSKRASPRKTRPSSWTRSGAPGRRTTSRREDGRPRKARPRRDI